MISDSRIARPFLVRLDWNLTVRSEIAFVEEWGGSPFFVGAVDGECVRRDRSIASWMVVRSRPWKSRNNFESVLRFVSKNELTREIVESEGGVDRGADRAAM